MSADNGIYIVKFPEGYRVAYAQAIENIDYFPEGSKKRKKELKSYFGQSKVYKTIDEAMKKAMKIYNEIMHEDCPIIEYGIQYLGEYESFKNK